MKTVKILVPEYFKEFKCIGSECEDTCCQGWNITVDKNSYKKYKRFLHADFSPLADQRIVLNAQRTNDYDYALINQDENECCQFLDGQKLCTIYQNMGASFMPHTCRTYPRYFNKVNGELEISLTLSCPEAARKALLNPEPMGFEYVHLPYDKDREAVSTNLSTEKQEYQYFWDIRIGAIRLLQNRHFSLAGRLTFIGMLYNKVQACIDHQNYHQIPIEIENFVNILEQSTQESILKNIEINLPLQVYFAKGMISEKTLGRNFSSKMLNYLNQAMDLLATDTEKAAQNIAETPMLSAKVIAEYEHIMKNEVEPFLQSDAMVMIENYLVNEYFRTLMPFGAYENMHNSLIFLATNYAMIKTLIAGNIYAQKTINQEILFDIIYSFSKSMTHNSAYFEFISSNLKNMEMDNLGGLYSLIAL